MGDVVRLKRAGDVIPQVIGPVVELRTGDELPVPLPAVCPSCGEAVRPVEDEVALYCDNPACPAQLVRRIQYWVSRLHLPLPSVPNPNCQLLRRGLGNSRSKGH